MLDTVQLHLLPWIKQGFREQSSCVPADATGTEMLVVGVHFMGMGMVLFIMDTSGLPHG